MKVSLKSILPALLALCVAKARGQDSLSYVVTPNSLHAEMLDARLQSPLGVSLLERTSFSYITLEYGRQSGSLMRVQTPRKASDVRLRSIGLHSAERWQLYGEFSYTRQYEDSVQWLLSERPQNGMPYYFGSPRKGNWDIEQYDIKGLANWNVSRLILIGGTLQIAYRKGARSNDPRPSTESFVSQYRIFGGITLPRFSTLADAGFGYGTRDNDLIYNNSDNDNPLRLDMMAYELMGFGLNRKTQVYQNRVLETDVYTRHFGLQLRWDVDSLMLWGRFGYDTKSDSIRRSRTTNVSTSLLSTYKTTQLSFNAGADYTFSRSLQLQTQAYAIFTNGHDRLDNILQGQKNYVYTRRQLGLQALLRHTSVRQSHTQYGLSLAYDYEKKQDGVTEHRFEHSGIDASLMAHRQQYVGSPKAFYVFYGLQQSVYVPSRVTLSYPDAQENIFSTDVARPYYNYYRTPNATTGMNLGGGKVFGRYNLALSLTYKLAYALRTDYGVSGTRGNFGAAIIFNF